MAQFTLIGSKHRLTKRYWLDEIGFLKYEVGAHLTDGRAQRIEDANDIQSFMDQLLAPMKIKHWALCSGVTEYATARIVPKDKVAAVRAMSSEPVVARSKEYFQHPDGLGVLVLDYDGEPISKEDLYAAWLEACPWLEDVGIGFMPSTGVTSGSRIAI